MKRMNTKIYKDINKTTETMYISWMSFFRIIGVIPKAKKIVQNSFVAMKWKYELLYKPNRSLKIDSIVVAYTIK